MISQMLKKLIARIPRMISTDFQWCFWKSCARYDKIAKKNTVELFSMEDGIPNVLEWFHFYSKVANGLQTLFWLPLFSLSKKWMEGLEWSSFRSERLQGICAFQKLPSGIWIFHRVSNCPSRFEAISRCLSDRQDAEAASAGTKRLQMALTGSEGKHAQWPQPLLRNFER